MRAIAQTALIAVLFAGVITGLFVAWWIGVCALLGYGLYVAVRRIVGPKRGSQRPVSSAPGVIEGEYRVVDEVSPRLGDRVHNRH